MNVACPECRSVFRVDPMKVPPGGTRARCAVCGGVMAVAAPAAFAEGRATPLASTAVATPAARTPVASAPVAPAAPAAPPAPRTTPAPGVGGAWPPPQRTPGAGASGPAAAPSSAPARQPAPPAPPAPPAASTQPAAASASPAHPRPAPGPAGSTPAAGRPSGGRPINPFLSNDPNQKARRLARALVSDMVAYHPQLREQALREGTLKQTFRDEIKKSYEEYVDQIGKEFAEGTSHFQDALNEILAAGRKLF